MKKMFAAAVLAGGLLAGLSGVSNAASPDVGGVCLSGDQGGCLAAVDTYLASLRGSSSCSANAVRGINDLAGTTIAVSKVDADLALKIAQRVASGAPSCLQVAYGAQLDGTGTASTGNRGKGRGGEGREGEERKRPRQIGGDGSGNGDHHSHSSSPS